MQAWKPQRKKNKNQDEEIQELINTQKILNDMAVTYCEASKAI